MSDVITERQFMDFYGLTLVPVGVDTDADYLRNEVVTTIQKNYLKYIEKIVRAEVSYQSKRPGADKVPMKQLAMQFLIPGLWEPYFGGEPWNKIAVALCDLEGANVSRAAQVIDHIHDLEHNTATVMNRCMDGNTFANWLSFKMKATPNELAQKCSPEVRKLIKIFGPKTTGVPKVEVPEFEILQVWYLQKVLDEDTRKGFSPSEKVLVKKLKTWLDDTTQKIDINADDLKRLNIIISKLYSEPSTPNDDTGEFNEGRELLTEYFKHLTL